MNTLVNSVLAYIQTFSLDNPSSYLVLALICLAIMKKWKILILTLTTYIFATVARDLIVMNLQTAHIVIGVPLIIYCTGGFIIAGITLIAFVKYMLA